MAGFIIWVFSYVFVRFDTAASTLGSHVDHGPDTNLVPPRGTKSHMVFLIGLCM